jgi:Tfp pilus assembly protein PilF
MVEQENVHKMNVARWLHTLLVLALVLVLASCAAPEKKTPVAEKPPEPKVDPKAAADYQAALDALQAGDVEKAKQLFVVMSKTYPNLSGSHTNLGIIHFHAGETEAAEAAFKKALAINPNNAVSLNHLGIISRGKGEFKQAQAYYERALQIDPNYAYAHLNYGILLELYMGKLSDALAHYKQYQSLIEEKDGKVEKWIVDLERRVKHAKSGG